MRSRGRDGRAFAVTASAEVLVGAIIAVGLVGVVLPVVPGSLIIGGAITVWAYATGGAAAWLVLALAATMLVAAGVGKWFVAERHLRGAGVPRSTMVVAGLAGIVGFFVVPVVGLFVGFAGGLYAVERRRKAHSDAWRSTVAALRATGLVLLVELAGALLAAAVWVVGAVTV